MKNILKSKSPIIYEINTWVWLSELSERYNRKINLKNVPVKEWNVIIDIGVDAIWFMGVWERSPMGTVIAREHKALHNEYGEALSDFKKEDVVGSPYAVRQYVVDKQLGGWEGLAVSRKILADHNIALILDYVPNHVALDNPLVHSHPEYLVRGDRDDLSRTPQFFFDTGKDILAHGKDPYFPAWTDTVQLNAFSEGLRKETINTISDIASQCDGVRCDMAMLMVSHIFRKTWKDRVDAPPEQEFWEYIIKEIRKVNPEFIFMAEAYWGMEWDLQKMGFDFCYDKRLYDRLVEGNAHGLQLHLQANLDYQKKLVRFIENHDEPRALSTFGEHRTRLAALTICTLPGARLIHEGQLEGYQKKLPVQLGRRAIEKTDRELTLFYAKLFKTIKEPAFGKGEWQLCEKSGWEESIDYLNLVSWCWKKEESRWLIVINPSARTSQGRVHIPWNDLEGKEWLLKDIFTVNWYDRSGKELSDKGLYVKLEPWGFHLFEFMRS